MLFQKTTIKVVFTINTASNPGTWNKQEIEQFIAALDYSYQKIALPYGLSTRGIERTFLTNLAFGSNLEGKTVLDIGSYLGYFCLEACERGAEQVVGLELDPARVKEAKTIAAIKGLEPQYRIEDVEELNASQKFDIVLCLNILHHLFEPVHVLHKLAKITRETLILEVASFGRHDRSKMNLPTWLIHFIKNKPVILVRSGLPKIGKRSQSQKYFFTKQALVNILGQHTGLFSKVEVFPSDFKDRFVIKATRRKIGHLVLVAGPTSSGKSALLKALQENRLPSEVAAKLPQAACNWPQIGASKFIKKEKTRQGEQLSSSNLDGLILHYDLLRPFTSGTHSYARDQALDLIQCAESVTVLTLKPPQKQLIKQLLESELGNKKPVQPGAVKDHDPRKRVVPHLLKRTPSRRVKNIVKSVLRAIGLFPAKKQAGHHQKLYFLYQDEQWLASWYENWFRFITTSRSDAEILSVVPNADQNFSWHLEH